MERQQRIEAILERFESPGYRGTLPSPPATAVSGENLACGDAITLTVEVLGGRIGRVRWSGSGCTLSVAGADIAAEMAEGHTLAQVLAADPDEVLEALGREVVLTRRECATLGARTLRSALQASTR